ncbi:MAG: hypothetical protein M3082_16145, partial [Candidatus Dormibacteraeota bacterium]|nr:hypothetical protein [Candidatus Dormibacteraeota bacterium]
MSLLGIPGRLQHAGRIFLALLAALVAALAMATSVWGSPGDIDPTFGTTSSLPGRVIDRPATWDFFYVRGQLPLPNGDILLVGGGHDIDGRGGFAIVRFKQTGELDTSFGTGGGVIEQVGPQPGGNAEAVIPGPNGTILVAGSASDETGHAGVALARFNSDGSPDTSFGSGGNVITTLGPDANAHGYALVRQASGRVVVAGDVNFSHDGPAPGFAFIGYTPNGSLDTGFGDQGRTVVPLAPVNPFSSPPTPSVSTATSLVMLPDQRLVAAGYATVVVGGFPDTVFALTRLSADGALDPGFGTQRKVLTQIGSDIINVARGLALQSDGKLVVAGSASGNGCGVCRFVAARYNTDGSLDTDFGSAGFAFSGFDGGTPASTASFGEAVAIQPNGKIVVAGRTLDRATSLERIGIVRFTRDGALDQSFGTAGDVALQFPTHGTFLTATAVSITADGGILVGGYEGAGYAALTRLSGDAPLQPPSAPTLISPADHAILIDKNVTFQWSAAEGADTYDLIVDDNVVKSGIADTQTTVPLDFQDHTWRVVAKNSTGSTPSASRSFTTHDLRLIALGDSVTGAFGYRPDGQPYSIVSDPGCVLDSRRDRCQSPSVVAYPAVFARRRGLSFWRNIA